MAGHMLRKTFNMIDIGANLTDPMFRGIYHESKKHQDDFSDMLNRAKDYGLKKIIVTGGSLEDCKEALALSQQDEILYSTAGCHPTRCEEIDKSGNPDEYIQSLISLAKSDSSKIVAVGECGLDYDRLQFCPAETQKKYFQRHFEITEATGLPMFLHCRNAASDLIDLIKKNRDRFGGGVVHSFDGTLAEAKTMLELDLCIGINGCSLKTEQNLEVLKCIPLHRIMIETDCPWCEIKQSHASFRHVKTQFPSKKKEKWAKDFLIKGRNEAVNLIQILEVVAAVREEDIELIAQSVYDTSDKLFFPGK